MSIVQAIVLGIVQGLTEFIPISSTAHLRIVPALLGWGDPGAAASAVIQIGTLFAVLLYFRTDLLKMAVEFFKGIIHRKPFENHYSRLAWYIGFATIPIGVVGLTFKDWIETTARSLWIISFALIALAIVLLIAEKMAAKRESLRVEDDITFADAMWIGVGQTLALIPGVSRSGSTITAGLFRGLSHAAAARFSFLMSVPAIFASGMFELLAEWDHLAALGWGSVIISVIAAFLSGWASIWFLIRYLQTHNTNAFIYYRIVLGLVIMAMLSTGWLV